MAKKINNDFWHTMSAKFFKVHCELRTTVAHPYILEKIMKKSNLEILDYGCGEGDLSIELANSANRISAIDISELSIRESKQSYGDKSNLKFSLLKDLDFDIKYDVIILSFVLVTIKSKIKSLELMDTVKKLLKKDGKIYFIDTHPCFRDKLFSTSRTKFNYLNYNKNYIPFQVELSDCMNAAKHVVFEDYHKSLAEIFSLFTKNNFFIKELDELYDEINDNMANSIKFKYNPNVPIYLYMEAVMA